MLIAKSSRTRSAIAFVVAAVAFALLSAGAAQAAPVPPPDGSYRESCRDIKASSRVLKARCQTRRGPWVNARLEAYLDCRGDIANDDGRLVCRERPGDIILYEGAYYRGRALPLNADTPSLPRWWNDRASSIRVRRGVWQICVDWNYRGRCETIRADVADLRSLRLDDRISSLRRVALPPRGSYLEHCRNIEFDGRILRADCPDRRGRIHSSELDLRTCERGADIYTRRGELTCDDRDRRDRDYEGPGPRDDGRYDDGRDRDDRTGEDRDDRDRAPMPRGSYQQTCRNVHVDQGVLRAECQDRGGAWRRTNSEHRQLPRRRRQRQRRTSLRRRGRRLRRRFRRPGLRLLLDRRLDHLPARRQDRRPRLNRRRRHGRCLLAPISKAAATWPSRAAC